MPQADGEAPSREPRVPAVPRARRVLVVDDSRDAADSLAALLEMQGQAVEVAYDGPAALAACASRPPDMVFCDIGLPGMSGYEVARRLRADGYEAQLVALSGYAQPDDVARALAAGFHRHLAKPADPVALEALLA